MLCIHCTSRFVPAACFVLSDVSICRDETVSNHTASTSSHGTRHAYLSKNKHPPNVVDARSSVGTHHRLDDCIAPRRLTWKATLNTKLTNESTPMSRGSSSSGDIFKTRQRNNRF
ncbi:hypothetical protein VFPPC_15718 [Pochonia chlamydosporia 170]|uniref:Uncharacterized protein n=1 Tax=Pochonia chlamydosporia 170 TaxID=1380566 RepID=A0A179FQX2_METCM|nr:hypothetical protein VFPPC_15718 [Pochonia chlamydosporia 170]OAQ67658.2 hypothetical protein VFPPC_15718 [Pochonia chlamydosporia 170]